jgi:hypothetical protein
VIRFSGTVLYRDGRTEEWSGGGALQADWEDYALRHELPLNLTAETVTHFPAKRWALFLAYSALDVEEGFDVWRKRVEDVDLDNDNAAAAVPPTLAVATDG